MADRWWVKAWNWNLENYSDYPNRLPRGRRYLRNGSVLDLRSPRGGQGEGPGEQPQALSVDVGTRSMSEGRKGSIARECAGKV